MKKIHISDHFTPLRLILFSLPAIGMQLVDNIYQVADAEAVDWLYQIPGAVDFRSDRQKGARRGTFRGGLAIRCCFFIHWLSVIRNSLPALCCITFRESCCLGSG